MKIALAQINPSMGNISLNQKKILNWCLKAKKQQADLIIFPEMATSGYSPLDILKQKCFLQKTQAAVQAICQRLPSGLSVILGSPASHTPPATNSALVLQKNKCKIYSKQILADYDVFDEKRYFKKGLLKDNFFYLQKIKTQLLICEEMWQLENHHIQLDKPQLIISIHASPFEIYKHRKREMIASRLAQTYQCPFVYMNLVGGQEELIFDGGSFILNPQGEKLYQAPFFKEHLTTIPLKGGVISPRFPAPMSQSCTASLPSVSGDSPAPLISALVFGIKEFVRKNNFKKIHLGLSGGLDSAVLSHLACQALGAKNVSLIFLPGPFTSSLSFKAVQDLSQKLNCQLYTYSITPTYQRILKNWPKGFGKSRARSKENLQARIRCLYLMAWSNQYPQSLLLGSSNKSELSLGYATLYGDLSCGLLPIGDLFKTEVLQLAKHLKRPAIPHAIQHRPPSAELRANQTDAQDIPPYQVLDPILKKLIELQKDPQNKLEKNIFKQILLSEFKRRQAAPILKVKERSFDRGWRYPLSVQPKFF